jgi:tetratricopeptide (TPR) repeat protein
MHIHPSDIFLRELLEDPRCVSQRVRAHLGECAFCRQRTFNLLSTIRKFTPDYGYLLRKDLDFIALWQQRLARERSQAPKLLSVLLDQPETRRELLIRNHSKFQTWGLLELILEQGHGQTFKNPAAVEDMGNLALLLSDHLSPSLYGLERIEDLRARAWAYIGNSLRIRVNLEGAERAFEKAFAHLRQGTGEVLERASILNFKASLKKDQHQFAASLRLLQRAVQVFGEAGDEHQVGRSLVSMAVIHYIQGEPDAATRLTQKALLMLDFKQEPRAMLCAQHNLIVDLTATGRLMDAQGALAKARPVYHLFPEPWAQSRLHYAQGQIYRCLGLYHEAKTQLRDAYDAFLAANLPDDAASVHREILALPI